MQPGFDQKAWQRQQPGRHPGCQPHDMAVFNENVQNWAFSASIQIRNAADHAQELEKRKTAHKGGPRWQIPVPYPSWNPSHVFGTHQWRWNAPWRFLKPQHFSMLLGSFSFAKSMLSILSNSMLRACYPDAKHVLHKCLHVAKMVLKWCFRLLFKKVLRGGMSVLAIVMSATRCPEYFMKNACVLTWVWFRVDRSARSENCQVVRMC